VSASAAHSARPARLARLTRLLTVVLTAAGLLLAAAPPASAHTELRATDPAADSTLDAAPPAVTLTFSGSLLGGDVTVTGPDGNSATSGPATVDGAVLSVPVALESAGRYAVDWSATAGDGHPLRGSFGFDVRTASAAPASTPAPATASTRAPAAAGAPRTSGAPDDVIEAGSAGDDDGTPGWVLPAVVAGAVAVLAAALVPVVRRSRARR
jgi:methionine-rich copper-binding protein CopC